ncbi:oligopeptide transport ATP-binding protein OppF [bacterium BMS3Abin01]|nr:oligopeptide transport ATP-binding protein OppF [bacterium BMS3Abin01]HDZ59727.1 ABC transporter ATP-binding protein [Actinomycetota bacterium]
MPLLEVENVSKIFPGRSGSRGAGGNVALHNVSLTLEKGGSLGIIGESGAGKTTLASLIVGLEQPSQGKVRLDGAVVGEQITLAEMAGRVQLVWQDAAGSLDPRMRIGAALAEPFRIQGMMERGRPEAISGMMEEVGLSPALARRYPHELSGGELQRAVIARALALEPALLICDEPASALDARLKRQIIGLLERLRGERGLSYVIIAHDVGMVRELTSELAILYRGEVVEAGPTDAVLSGPRHPYTQELIASVPRLPRRQAG